MWRSVAAGLVLGAMVAVLGAPSTARAAGDPREVKGRALFAKGEYQRALEIYATLFAEKGEPLYLRNIGRCYQKLLQPGKAIDSFKEYLRRSPRLKASEREEIQGFIHEMEELRAEQQKKNEPVAPPVSPSEARAGPVEPIKPPPSEPPARARPLRVVADDGAPGGAGSKPPLISKPGDAGGAKTDEGGSILGKWWFWTVVGGVVAGGAVATVLILNGRRTSFPDCMTGYTCPH